MSCRRLAQDYLGSMRQCGSDSGVRLKESLEQLIYRRRHVNAGSLGERSLLQTLAE
jgi:hypothetical protein